MNLIFALLCLTAAALADDEPERVCSGTGTQLKGFGYLKKVSKNQKFEMHRDIVNTRFPCKFHAVREQRCGNYTINMTPGNIFLHPNYRLNTIWLHVKKHDSSDYPAEIELRINNKKVVKFITGEKDYFWTKKSGSLEVEDIFSYSSIGEDSITAVAGNDDFEITFKAWDPDTKIDKFRTAEWSFECFDDSFVPLNNSYQLCGGYKRKERDERGFQNKLEPTYYDVFTKPGIEQTNPLCNEAEDLFSLEESNCTTETDKMLAIHMCSPILYSRKHYKCVTKYACDPMDVFVSCVKWVCSDFTWKEECQKLGRAIDFCRKFKEGNLSERVHNATCYTEFLEIPEHLAEDLGVGDKD